MKFTREMALITAVSDLRMFLEIVKGITPGIPIIDSLSLGEKSPSGPIKTIKDLLFLKLPTFKLFLEFTSANNIVFDLSKFFKKSFSFITSEITGGFN